MSLIDTLQASGRNSLSEEINDSAEEEPIKHNNLEAKTGNIKVLSSSEEDLK